jgi:glutathione synthase/RimK-type ligase-like ATP-grasp enzyme
VTERLAWVTAQTCRDLDEDEGPGLAGLAAAGVEVDVVAWDDPDVDWAAYHRAVLRSTWDYHNRLTDFRTWLSAADAVTAVINPVPMLRWNLDKHYLAELAAAGIPVIPTTFVEPGAHPAPVDGASVVKPSVGAASSGVRIHRPGRFDDLLTHVAALHAQGSAALVQPYLPSIGRDGEIPLIFFDGKFSHAVTRYVTQGPDGVDRVERSRPRTAASDEREVAEAAVAEVTARFGAPAYARVDLARDETGAPLVLEVELAEPSLFLPDGGVEAVDRFVAALTRAAGVTSRG